MLCIQSVWDTVVNKCKDELHKRMPVKTTYWLFFPSHFPTSLYVTASEEDSTASALGPVLPVVESLKVTVQEVCAFFDIENLDGTAPMLCLRTSIEANIANWSRQVQPCFHKKQLL